MAINSGQSFDDAAGERDLIDRKTIDVEPRVAESWFGQRYALEYEYRCTEYRCTEYEYEFLSRQTSF